MASKAIQNTLWCRNWAFNSVGITRHVRPFTKGGVPTFRPTSSPDIDKILASFRDNIFIPSRLPKAYRDMIYRTESRKALLSDADPVYVDLPCDTGETVKFRLKPIDRLRDEPQTRSNLNALLKMMKPEDFDVILPFLEGLYGAGRGKSIKEPMLEQIARKANTAGRHDVTIECARRVKTTGFKLKYLSVARELVRGPYLLAKKGDPSQTKKALSQAEQVIELLESPAHTKGRGVEPSDPRAQPDIVGVVLAIAAIQASKHNGGSDVNGKVATYANRMKGTWASSGLTIQPPLDLRRADAWHNQKLLAWVPVLEGARLAREVLGAESAEGLWLSEIIPEIEEELAQTRAHSEGRGDSLYDTLMVQLAGRAVIGTINTVTDTITS
ncbi:MAG: hypothetical protein M1839_008986 [Geoglossum umbratile]|nr:MAG: hypothetical protein M1839_008986 [Geoglossum umbratile]